MRFRKYIKILSAVLIGISLFTGCHTWGGREQVLSDFAPPARHVGAEQEGSGTLTLKEDPLWSDEGSLKAMVISDLHYTEDQDQDHSLVPGIAIAERITDTLIAEVIDRHPDVLIMTGDNTNSGYLGDVSRLVSKLQKIRDAGIHIVMTTGNHDFDLMDAGQYEQSYFGLLEPVDRNPASLSYTAIIKNTVFLAMDDYDELADWQGSFSPETIRWIGDMLEKYRDKTIIFLSHHNVLYGFAEEHDESYQIQNPELPNLLYNGNVRLAMTGHMHMQYITEKDGLWEILSGMPFSGNHLIGNLAVGKNKMIYYAEPVDFAEYGSSAGEELDRLDQESSEYMDQVFSELLESEGLHAERKKRVMNLIKWYFSFYYEGTLAQHKQELTGDPFYKPMIKALWNYNYGPWMKAMIEMTEYNAGELVLSW